MSAQMARPSFRRWLSAALVGVLATGNAATAAVPRLPEAKSVEATADRGLRIRWFGASTATVSDGHTTIMIDGFFSRPGIVRLGLAWTGLRLVRPDAKNLEEGLKLLGKERIHAIYVAHAHHDHVLDTAFVAELTGARVYGSKSVEHVVLPQRPKTAFQEIKDGSEINCAETKFSVKVFASSHEPTIFGPGGEIESQLNLPAGLREFRSGPSFSFLVSHPKGVVLIVPSAVIDGDPPNLTGVKADVVLLGVGLLGKAPRTQMERYWSGVVRATKPSRVHPIHWDNFMRPLSQPLAPIPSDRLDKTIPMLASFADKDDIEFSYLPIATTIHLPPYRHERSDSGDCL